MLEAQTADIEKTLLTKNEYVFQKNAFGAPNKLPNN